MKIKLGALAERRAGRGWSHTPASSAQNLLSTCVGLGYPGRSYPRGRESAPGEPEPPQKCDGRGAGTEDRTEIKFQTKVLDSPRLKSVSENGIICINIPQRDDMTIKEHTRTCGTRKCVHRKRKSVIL